MDLDKKYELGTVVANDSESKTFQAKELATGREVLVHILFGGTSLPGRETLLSMLLQRAVDPSQERRAPILEISDHKGMPYVATQAIEGFTNLRTWLETRAPGPAASPAPDCKKLLREFDIEMTSFNLQQSPHGAQNCDRYRWAWRTPRMRFSSDPS